MIWPTQWLKTERIRVDAGLGFKALHLSDLHVEKIRVSAEKVKRLIELEKPDYLFITGDFTQQSKALSKARDYMRVIGEAGVRTYAVLGNHDHRLPASDLKRLNDLLTKEGVTVLNNRCVDLGEFQLVGIDDLGSGKSNISKAYRGVDPAKPVIVLTHNPNLVLKLRKRYDLLLAGHFHGMQFHIPWLFRFVKKGDLPAKGIYKGLHSGEYGRYYISKGISQAGPNARFLVRSEAAILEL
ncbi:metallophosphoesterase [Paenibacillus sp. NPDC058071]|uniref:metallophosphoesterase n=1 Tax=Paenibacillus sp. NPDC058071 TaxID=3346326 RepID=UPI0036D87584